MLFRSSPSSALPPGLAFDTVSCAIGCAVTGGAVVTGPTQLGRITGTPTAYGSYTFDVRVADSAGHTNDETVLIRINGVDITSPQQLPDAHVGQPYIASLTASGVGPWTWRITANSLPPGLALNGDTISGIPTGGSFYYGFSIRVVDSIGQHATKNIAIFVASP